MRRRRTLRAWRTGATAAAAAAIALLTAPVRVAAASAAVAPASVAPATPGPVAVEWRPWTADAFSEARRSGRLILLHVTTAWSRSAHEMDRDVWTDSALVSLVRSGFVPVRVDADRRPDVADRYLSTGYPTTAVLDAEGQVLMSGAVIATPPIQRMLEEIRTLVRKNRPEIIRRSAESSLAVQRTWEREEFVPSEMPFEEWLALNVDAVREGEDKKHGGFGSAPKLPRFESIALLHAASSYRDDPALRGLALRATDAALRLEDSTWGGFFRFARDEDWKRPRTEKLLSVNAAAIATLARAFSVSGEARYRAAARRTEAYVAGRLWDERRGGYYASQDADAGRGKDAITGDVFYGLSDRARRRRPAPAIDSIFTADSNARFASAIFAGARARVWEGAPVSRAVRALDRLWAEQRAPDGSIYHVWERGVATLPGVLADQAAAGLAYLDAHEATGDPRHLERARALGTYLHERLEDADSGGFRFAPRDTTAVGRLRAGEKPEAANVDAAAFLLRLWERDGRAEDLASATRAFERLRAGDVVRLDPSRAELGIRIAARRRSEPAR